MLNRAGDSVGILAPLTSLSTTTAVASTWATGAQYLSEYFSRNYLVRSEAASNADWLRSCSAFAGSTGTWTHDGTNYSDTTPVVPIEATPPPVVASGLDDTTFYALLGAGGLLAVGLVWYAVK